MQAISSIVLILHQNANKIEKNSCYAGGLSILNWFELFSEHTTLFEHLRIMYVRMDRKFLLTGSIKNSTIKCTKSTDGT